MTLFQTALYMIKRNESCSLKAYPDRLTGAEPWTIGWGSTGNGIGPDSVWTQEQCDRRLNETIVQTISDLASSYVLWFGKLDIPRQAVLVDMCYQLGNSRFRQFKRMLYLMPIKDWDGAAAEIVRSKYASEVPRRAARNIAQLITGIVV